MIDHHSQFIMHKKKQQIGQSFTITTTIKRMNSLFVGKRSINLTDTMTQTQVSISVTKRILVVKIIQRSLFVCVFSFFSFIPTSSIVSLNMKIISTVVLVERNSSSRISIGDMCCIMDEVLLIDGYE
jgi:hypothetical protein